MPEVGDVAHSSPGDQGRMVDVRGTCACVLSVLLCVLFQRGSFLSSPSVSHGGNCM